MFSLPLFDPPPKPERPRIIYNVPRRKTNLEACGLSVDFEQTPVDSLTFRFRRHRSERATLLQNLPNLPTTYKGLLRFKSCGEGAGVFYNPKTGCYKARSHTCGHRWCPACRERFTVELRKRLAASMKGGAKYAFKFITLTMRSTCNPLREDVDELFASFRRLRQTTLWKRRVSWGVAVLEITKNPKTKLFHPHLHIIAKSGFMPAKTFGRAWKKASSGSQNCDIRAIKNQTEAVNYVTKYISKGSYDEQTDGDGITLIEKLHALRRKKTVLWFGTRPELEEDEAAESEDSETIPSTFVCSLDSLIRAALAGMPKAQAILDALNSGERGPPP